MIQFFHKKVNLLNSPKSIDQFKNIEKFQAHIQVASTQFFKQQAVIKNRMP